MVDGSDPAGPAIHGLEARRCPASGDSTVASAPVDLVGVHSTGTEPGAGSPRQTAEGLSRLNWSSGSTSLLRFATLAALTQSPPPWAPLRHPFVGVRPRPADSRLDVAVAEWSPLGYLTFCRSLPLRPDRNVIQLGTWPRKTVHLLRTVFSRAPSQWAAHPIEDVANRIVTRCPAQSIGEATPS